MASNSSVAATQLLAVKSDVLFASDDVKYSSCRVSTDCFQWISSHLTASGSRTHPSYITSDTWERLHTSSSNCLSHYRGKMWSLSNTCLQPASPWNPLFSFLFKCLRVCGFMLHNE